MLTSCMHRREEVTASIYVNKGMTTMMTSGDTSSSTLQVGSLLATIKG